jgi:hypothetical protein
MVKPATIRFYIDEDLLGLAHVVAALRPDVTYPGDPGAVIHKRERPPSPIAKQTDDDVWVPEATSRGWLIISRDHNIRENVGERRTVRECGARMVALSGTHAVNKWDQLQLLMTRWNRIESLLAQPGPVIYLATRSRMTPLDLDD